MNFINTGLDEQILKSMDAEHPTEELVKAMNRSGLVQKKITDKNGHQTTRWVKASEDQPADKPTTQNKDESHSKSQINKNQVDTQQSIPKTKEEIQKLVASGKSKEDIMKLAKDAGITWKENDHAGINWMRCCMAMTNPNKASSTNNKPNDTNKKDTAKKNDSNTSKKEPFNSNDIKWLVEYELKKMFYNTPSVRCNKYDDGSIQLRFSTDDSDGKMMSGNTLKSMLSRSKFDFSGYKISASRQKKASFSSRSSGYEFSLRLEPKE